MDENLYSCDVELTNLMGSFDDFSSCFSSRVLGDNDVFFFDLFCLDLKCKSHVVAMMYIFKIFIPGNIKRYVFEAIPKINIKYTKAKENTSLEEYENSKKLFGGFSVYGLKCMQLFGSYRKYKVRHLKIYGDIKGFGCLCGSVQFSNLDALFCWNENRLRLLKCKKQINQSILWSAGNVLRYRDEPTEMMITNDIDIQIINIETGTIIYFSSLISKENKMLGNTDSGALSPFFPN